MSVAVGSLGAAVSCLSELKRFSSYLSCVAAPEISLLKARISSLFICNRSSKSRFCMTKRREDREYSICTQFLISRRCKLSAKQLLKGNRNPLDSSGSTFESKPENNELLMVLLDWRWIAGATVDIAGMCSDFGTEDSETSSLPASFLGARPGERGLLFLDNFLLAIEFPGGKPINWFHDGIFLAVPGDMSGNMNWFFPTRGVTDSAGTDTEGRFAASVYIKSDCDRWMLC
mmetsp:Transcript_35859/g.75023  ORF Transcript_35859/g.75023 Transcript_35859/m.75023 type:complete len:231 (-) Transcript_35859:207-899(-)